MLWYRNIVVILYYFCIKRTYILENIHQVGNILFQTNFIITQLAMVYLLIRFDHHRGQTQLCDRQGGREGAKVVAMETNRCARWIKEAIWIRKTKPTMNRDEGGYTLSHAWDNAHHVI